MNEQAVAAVALYAGLNGLLMLAMIGRTSMLRRRYKVYVGDGGVPHLLRAMRGHSNAAENVPVTMVLLLVAALLGAPALAIHILGIAFTVGRLLHAVHFMSERAPLWQRGIGFGLSFLVTLAAAIGAVGHALALLF